MCLEIKYLVIPISIFKMFFHMITALRNNDIHIIKLWKMSLLNWMLFLKYWV